MINTSDSLRDRDHISRVMNFFFSISELADLVNERGRVLGGACVTIELRYSGVLESS